MTNTHQVITVASVVAEIALEAVTQDPNAYMTVEIVTVIRNAVKYLPIESVREAVAILEGDGYHFGDILK